MAKSIFSGGFSTVAVEIPSCFCSISGFCHGCLENWRTPLGHDKMNRLGGRGGTVLWACFPPASWICHNCWLHQALTWIESNISLMTCWVNATQHFSCYPYLLFTPSVSLFLPPARYCCLALFSFSDIWQGYSSPSSPRPRFKCHSSTSCSSQPWSKLLPIWCHSPMSFICLQ